MSSPTLLRSEVPVRPGPAEGRPDLRPPTGGPPRRRTAAPPGDPARRRAVGRGAPSLALAGGVAVALWAASVQSVGSLRAAGGIATAVGRLTGLEGSYLLLLTVALAARLPLIERAVGQDRMLGWHRRLGPWPLLLLTLHGVAITLGYAQSSGQSLSGQAADLLGSYPDVLAATVGYGLLLAAGVTSVRKARAKMSYETWWAVHLYTYLALALAFAHQLVTGAAFVGHPLATAVWCALWGATAGVVAVYRVGLPLTRSLRTRLRVVQVHDEGPGVVSVILRGRGVARLGAAGGQYLQWRILRRDLWWQAHPYSLSALPQRDHLRVTVKDLGDHSRAMSQLTPGTRVAVEGPYGTFTAQARLGGKVLLVGAGVGVAPLRALLEELPPGVEVTMVVRAATAAGVVHHAELRGLLAARGGQLHTLLGHRSEVDLTAQLGRRVGDLHDHDVFVCGPQGFAESVGQAVRAAGCTPERWHAESFTF